MGGIGGGAALNYLEDVLKSPNAKIRLAALRGLKGTCTERSARLILACLNDPSPEVHAKAAEVRKWVKIANPARQWPTAPFLEALPDGGPELRGVAAQELRYIKSPEAASALESLQDDPNPTVRAAVIEYWGDLKASQAFERVLDAIEDEEMIIRVAAIRALAQIDESRAVEPLILRLDDAEISVRSAAVKILGQIHAVQAVPALIRCLADRVLLPDENARVCDQALYALYSIGTPDAQAAITADLEQRRVQDIPPIGTLLWSLFIKNLRDQS